MPSQLLRRVRSVQWSDFLAPPPPNSQVHAHIETDYNLAYTYVSGPSGVQLNDNVTVTIRLLQNRSWAKKQIINSWPSQAQQDLLRHEQGHYDITALMGRDLFIEVMALKPQTFSNLSALQTALQTISQRYAAQPVHNKYDHSQETDHGRNAQQQRAWNNYIHTASTTPRTPAVHAPDGAVYKVRLVDVLRTAGKLP